MNVDIMKFHANEVFGSVLVDTEREVSNSSHWLPLIKFILSSTKSPAFKNMLNILIIAYFY